MVTRGARQTPPGARPNRGRWCGPHRSFGISPGLAAGGVRQRASQDKWPPPAGRRLPSGTEFGLPPARRSVFCQARPPGLPRRSRRRSRVIPPERSERRNPAAIFGVRQREQVGWLLAPTRLPMTHVRVGPKDPPYNGVTSICQISDMRRKHSPARAVLQLMLSTIRPLCRRGAFSLRQLAGREA